MSIILDLLRLVVFKLIDFFIPKTKTTTEKTMLLLRVDGIGDYVLFRNFIKVIKEDPKYAHYKITFVGNKLWKDLAIGLDHEYFDREVFVDQKQFTRNIFYRYKVLSELNTIKYEVVLSSVYSRDFFFGDWIAHGVAANMKIGSKGDLTNRTAWQRKIGDTFYTQLIDSKSEVQFEFFRNKEFFEALLQKHITLDKPTITSRSNSGLALPNSYALLYIGASSPHKKWSLSNYAAIASYLRATFNFEIVLCGGPSDITDAHTFALLYKEKFVNLVGKTSLMDMIELVSKSDFILTNETNASHFAAAIGSAPFLVMASGEFFGRFTPYPKIVCDKFNAIYPPIVEENINHLDQLVALYGKGSNLNVDDIGVDSVKQRITEILKSKFVTN